MTPDLSPLAEAIEAMTGDECRRLSTMTHLAGKDRLEHADGGPAGLLFSLAAVLANVADDRARAFAEKVAEPPGCMFDELDDDVAEAVRAQLADDARLLGVHVDDIPDR